MRGLDEGVVQASSDLISRYRISTASLITASLLVCDNVSHTYLFSFVCYCVAAYVTSTEQNKKKT